VLLGDRFMMPSSRHAAAGHPPPALLIVDCPERCDGLRDPEAPWDRIVPTDLTQCARALWRAARGGNRAWQTRATRALAPVGFYGHLLVAGEARGSQVDGLQEMLRHGLAPGRPAALIALAGQGFHGRAGRPWAALEGNLHLSVMLPARVPAAPVLPSVTMLAALATIEAIERATDRRLRPGIKWVNDLLLDGRKVAGVLAATILHGAILKAAILGIGVNVARTPRLPTGPLTVSPCSLAEMLGGGRSPDICDLTFPLLDAIGRRALRLFDPRPRLLISEYRRRALGIGGWVRVYEQEGAAPGAGAPGIIAEGILEAIGPDLSLHLAGHPEPITRGHLTLL